jgi:hypothetical protein
MVGPINLKLLTDFFNKIGQKATSPSPFLLLGVKPRLSALAAFNDTFSHKEP